MNVSITVYVADEGLSVDIEDMPYTISKKLDAWDVEDFVACLHHVANICKTSDSFDVEVQDVRGEG